MRFIDSQHVLPAIIASAAIIGAAEAATIDSSLFNGVTNGAISTTGLADWGYVSTANVLFDSTRGVDGSYNLTPYGSLTSDEGPIITTVYGSSTIGAVTLTEGAEGTDVVGAQNNTSNFTFGGATAYGSYGNFAPGEQNVWSMTFNDLGIGTTTITLYLGHSSTNRSFDMDVSLLDGGAPITTTTTTGGAISGLGSTIAAYGSTGAAFTYDITVTTSTPTASLTLTHGDTGGGSSGGAMFAGYTVSQIPEPSSALLGILGALMLLRRRR